LPSTTVAALEEFIREHATRGVLGTWPYDERMTGYREAIGRFIGASGDEIATVPNTSIGANVVARGIDWKPGDRAILCDNEFPSNAVPWVALRELGVEVTLLPTAHERLTPDRLRREITPNTRAVAVSWVSYADGYRHDLAGLAEVAHASGALLCVDAIQGLGALPLDVRACGVDALYSGGGKWMLALHGIGFAYVRRELIEQFNVAMPGWRSFENMWDFENYTQPHVATGIRYEAGTPNLIGTLSLNCAIELFESAGKQRIAEHVLSLTDHLCEGLQRRGAVIASIRGAGTSSGAVLFSMPGCDSVVLGRSLLEQGFVTTHRASGIRIAPHAYNTVEDIDALLERLPA
jgi:selenocysteine lyase/cysteine desulfurase